MTKIMRNLWMIILIVCVGILLLGGVVEAAEQKRISVYTSLDVWEAERLLNRFTEDTGIKATFMRLSAGEMFARVYAEKAAPKADIIIGASTPEHSVLAGKDLLEHYASPNTAEVDPRLIDPEGYTNAFFVWAIGFGVNKNLVEKAGLQYPETWNDLLDPCWKDEIVVAKPYASSTSYTMVSSILQWKGESAGFEYLKKLGNNVLHYTSSGAAPCRSSAAGEIMIGISAGHDILKTIRAGYKVKLIYPKPTGWSTGAVSIVKGGPNTEGAEKFIDWCFTKSAQQLHADISYRIGTIPGIIMPPGTPALEDLELIKEDFEWMKVNHDKICDTWKKEVE